MSFLARCDECKKDCKNYSDGEYILGQFICYKCYRYDVREILKMRLSN